MAAGTGPAGATPPPRVPAPRVPTDWSSPAMRGRIAARYRAERLFNLLGLAALGLAGLFLAFMLLTIIRDGWSGFRQTEVRVMISFDPLVLGIDPAAARGPGGTAVIRRGDFTGLMQASAKGLGTRSDVISEGAWLVLRDRVIARPAVLGTTAALWVPTTSHIDLLAKGHFDLAAPALVRGASDAEVADFKTLQRRGLLRTRFNSGFFTGSDSTDPELAGIGGAALGSLLTLMVAIGIAFPIGVLAAIWLEEFAPRNLVTGFIEASINNLAVVPSIIFGLLGLAVFINVFNMPRAAPLVGGLTLALMTLPVIVISARAALRAVPPSIRDAAFGIGASPIQTVFQHVVPLALPGILTGAIIGTSRALGEAAPLLLIGMRAFVTGAPGGISAPATVLPVQIFLWSDGAQRGFVEKTAAAILVLLVVLLVMNSAALWLRDRVERQW